MFSSPPRVNCFRLMFALIPFVLFGSITQQAKAEEVSTEKWDISADKVIRYENPSSIVAQGNVTLIKKEQLPPTPKKAKISTTAWTELLEEEIVTPEIVADEVTQESVPEFRTTITIRADWMVYDVELESIKAKGNLEITTKEDKLYAKEGTLNLINETGKFGDATILREEGSLHLEGKSIEKTGFDTYRIVDGWVITCKIEEGETPPWSFASSSVDVKPGGYAVLKHARFKIKDIPVLYSPYLIVPVKNTRQTGFLFPEFSTSDNNGFGFNLPFFLNISESADATFYPEYLTDRGFMPGLEFRYVSSVIDKGAFTANYLDDKLSDPSEIEYYRETGYTHDNSDRYWVRGKADHTFAGWQSRLDLDIVSDQDYLREFDSGVTGFSTSQDQYLDVFGRGFQNRTDTLRQNTFKILNSWDGISLEASLFTINDADTNSSDTNTPLWKLPAIDFSGAVPIGETSLSFDWNADYVDYWRDDGIGGHRFDIKPSISTPIPLGAYLESRAELALRDTFYIVQTYGEAEWDNDDTQNRLMPEFEADLATTLARDFYKGGSTNRSFNHRMRPFVNYFYNPDVNQDDLPDFDDVDFIPERNLISYGIDNFFDAFSTDSDNQETRREYGYLKIEQSYDLSNQNFDDPFSEIYAKLRWRPVRNAALTYKTFFDVYDSDFTSHTVESSYTNSRGDFFGLDYSYKDDEDIDQINAILRTRIFSKWLVGGEVEHSISNDETARANVSLTYLALCWSVKVETRYTPEDTTYMLLFNLANIGFPIGVKY